MIASSNSLTFYVKQPYIAGIVNRKKTVNKDHEENKSVVTGKERSRRLKKSSTEKRIVGP